MEIKISDSIEILSEILEKKIIASSNSWIDWALDSIMEFKAKYKIEGCSTEEESDELLAEYGIYSWNPDKKPVFEFTLTRQVLIEGNEEYFQVKFKLIYNPITFGEIESRNFWSMNYGDLEKWKQEVQKTDGFKKADETEILDHQLYLGMT